MSVVVLLSGGIDSTCLLTVLRSAGESVHALGIDYGQSHVIELTRAKAICQKLGVPYERANLSGLRALLPGSLLTGHGASPVVSNRNAIMASVAAGYAAAHGHSSIALAVHHGDCDLFPDCRPEFIEALRTLVSHVGIDVLTPFLHVEKRDLVRAGLASGAPLTDTWSCYSPGPVPCRLCLACIERSKVIDDLPS